MKNKDKKPAFMSAAKAKSATKDAGKVEVAAYRRDVPKMGKKGKK